MMQEFEANATRKWCDVDHFTERRTGERHVERLEALAIAANAIQAG